MYTPVNLRNWFPVFFGIFPVQKYLAEKKRISCEVVENTWRP